MRAESGARHALSLAIQIDDDAGELPADRARIRRWARAALGHDARLLLRFVGRREARALNARYRQRDKPTNVLTFCYALAPVVEADIVICLGVVRDEAARARIPVAEHLAHLVVHGVLHAQGHDHEDDDAAERMERLEARILQRFRIADPYRPATARTPREGL
ncbi:MAG: rRNA maturation RNase YbeY [Lautropia sp.]